jgi:hypothetical protein
LTSKQLKTRLVLDGNELMIACSELKQVFAAGDVNSWRSQVRKAQSNTPTHIQIANMYIKANKNALFILVATGIYIRMAFGLNMMIFYLCRK